MLKKILFVLLACWLSTAAFAQAKQRIEKAADMPRFSYKIDGQLEDLVKDEKAFSRFAAEVRRDFQSVLDGYEIADKAAHRDLLTVLAQIDFLEGRYAEAARRAEEIRALEEKPAEKLISGMGIRTMVAAQAKAGNTTSEAYRQEVGRQIAAELAKYPYPVIANDIKNYNRSAEITGEALLLGSIRDQLQPVVDKAGGVLSSDFAPDVVRCTRTTPFGQPSSPLTIGSIEGRGVVILARHGRQHTIPPSQVNYRANIQALKSQGCTHILATTACGSLREEIKRGDIVILDQFIDFTRFRPITFFEVFPPGAENAKHTSMADPFSEPLRQRLITTAKQLGLSFHERGTVVTH